MQKPVKMDESASNSVTKPLCGIVMPISSIDDCSEAHWAEVRTIIEDAVVKAGLQPNLVSNADDIGVIQKRIIQNLYDNPIVICDVSARNPNVMFELGIRLAFDKPTIIIKDNLTPFSFDTAPIEHLIYRRDLRYSETIEFKTLLAEKIINMFQRINSGKSETVFLGHFGKFKVAKLDETEVPAQQFIMEHISEMRMAIRELREISLRSVSARSYPARKFLSIDLLDAPVDVQHTLAKEISNLPDIARATVEKVGDRIRLMYLIDEAVPEDIRPFVASRVEQIVRTRTAKARP
jgi:hypothetical protein